MKINNNRICFRPTNIIPTLRILKIGLFSAILLVISCQKSSEIMIEVPFHLEWGMNHKATIEAVKDAYPFSQNSGIHKSIGFEFDNQYNDYINEIEFELGRTKESATCLLTFSNKDELGSINLIIPSVPINLEEPPYDNVRYMCLLSQQELSHCGIAIVEIDTLAGVWSPKHDELLLAACEIYSSPDTSFYLDMMKLTRWSDSNTRMEIFSVSNDDHLTIQYMRWISK